LGTDRGAPCRTAVWKGPTMQYKEDYLKTAPLFAELDERFIGSLADYSELRTFSAGTAIVRQGAQESWDLGLYVIASGSVRIVRSDPPDPDRELTVLGVGECFGEMSVLDGEPRSASAIACEETECVFLGAIDFREALTVQPKIAINLLRMLSRRLREADQAPLD